jgi:hypothetical protein
MNTALFLGVKVTPTFHKELEAIPEEKRAILINNQGEYLHSHEDSNGLYLGKPLTLPHSIKDLELTEAHVISLLRRLTPQFDSHHNPLQLIAYALTT